MIEKTSALNRASAANAAWDWVSTPMNITMAD